MKNKQNSMLRVLISLFFIIIVIGISTVGVFYTMSSSDWSTSNYQGVKVMFYSLQNNEGSKEIDLYNSGMITGFAVDPDDPETGLPDLLGEQTDLFVPKLREIRFPSWVSSEWIKTEQTPKVYEWEAYDNEGNRHVYVLKEYKAYFYVSLTVDTIGSLDYIGSPPEECKERYQGWKLWIYIDFGNAHWYFQDLYGEHPDQAYFSIGKIVVDEEPYVESMDSTNLRVFPNSKNEVLPFYAYSGEDLIQYKDKYLNPEIFSDHALAYIQLNDFGFQYKLGLFSYDYKGDKIVIPFRTTVFVVGDWKVQNEEEKPDISKFGSEPTINKDLWGRFSDFWNSLPFWKKMTIGGIIALAIIIALVIMFFPYLMILGEFYLAYRSGKRGKK